MTEHNGEEISMAEWKPLKEDLSIWKKFDFDIPAVAVKYLYYEPTDIPKLEGHFALCEMAMQAGKHDGPFYIDKGNEDCMGKLPLGWLDEEPVFAESGQVGEMFQIFEEPRANQRLYDDFYSITPGVVNYIMFSKLDDCDFEPDLIIVAATAFQAEKIMRAYSYRTGNLWDPKATPVLGCSWLYSYPYLTGNINYVFTGMHFGMRARKVMPPGLVLMSIPFDWIPEITKNLNEMPWDLPAFGYDTREDWMKAEAKMYAELCDKAGGGESPFVEE